MKVIKLTSAAIALASLSLVASCADQEESIIIAGAPAWQGPCSVQVPSQLFLARGLLDVRFETEYMLPLEIQNQLLSQSGDTVNSGTDNSELQITGVDVRLSSQQIGGVIDRLENEDEAFVDFSPAVPTNSLSGGGALGFLVAVIPTSTASKLAQYRVEAAQEAVAGITDEAQRQSTLRGVLARRETVVASVIVRARRTGNNKGKVGEIEAREFQFPIEICHGCTISCSTCEYDVDYDGDGMADDTISNVCPPGTLPVDPTARTFAGDFVGLTVDCPTAQDDTFVPNVDACAP